MHETINFILYWQAYLVRFCGLTYEEATEAVVRLANEVIDLKGATPDWRFSDNQCVFSGMAHPDRRIEVPHVD